MRLNAAKFNMLKPGPIKLGKWKKSSPPQFTYHPVRAVMRFARYMGLSAIPARTVEKMRSNPYFRYCLYQIDNYSIYNSPFHVRATIDRLVAMLKDPDLATDEDLYHGLSQYLNNFYLCFNEEKRNAFLDNVKDEPKDMRYYTSLYDAVDRVIQEEGLTERMRDLPAEIEEEITVHPKSYAKRAEYFKHQLTIFNTLVKRYNFDPVRLQA